MSHKRRPNDRDGRTSDRVGVTDSRVNRFGSSFIGGATYTGPFPGRHEDEIGLAIASARDGDEYQAAIAGAGTPVGNAETAVEPTCVARVRPWLQVQPDLEYIIDPNTDPRLDNALALCLRVAITC